MTGQTHFPLKQGLVVRQLQLRGGGSLLSTNGGKSAQSAGVGWGIQIKEDRNIDLSLQTGPFFFIHKIHDNDTII